jgi:hypothetical protein
MRNDGTFMPRVIDQPIMRYDRVLMEIQESTTLRSHNADLAIKRLTLSLIKYLSDGYKVETPFGVFRAAVHESFASETEDFYPALPSNNHEIEVGFRLNKDFVGKIVDNLNTERVADYSLKHPKVYDVANMNRPAATDIQPSEVLSLTGVNLKIDPDAGDEGVYWISQEAEEVKTGFLIENRNNNIKLIVPQLAAGSYTLKISTRLGNHQLRSSLHPETITIV